MTLAAGTKLSFYELLAPLGAGAMGEVWRALDTRLGREVAIKVLPDEFAADEERLARFEREARTLAALNHPNVAQIHGVDQVGDTCFLVLELVPGETLEERLRGGPLPLDEALEICRGIAEGLEAAHEAGVVHRDLKPANVRITPQGQVKVLDFGLAKPMRPGIDPRSSDSVLSTEAGRLLGTPTYMAPEQARGRAIDRRVDLWAFGCVLYECLTGKRAFDGESLSDVLGSVLRDEADLARLPAATPARVRELIARCLDKDPRHRLRDAGEARIALERAGDEPAPVATRRGPAAVLLTLPWILAVVMALLWARAERGAPANAPAPTHLAVGLPHALRIPSMTGNDQTGLIALAPDGSRLAFVALEDNERRLYLRALDAPAIVPVAGTDGASAPFFSPDGSWVAFFARGKLWKVAVAGGEPIALCEVGMQRGGAWGPDDSIVFSPSNTSPLMRIPASGGEPVALTKLDAARRERSHRWPAILPGGAEVAFTVGLVEKPGDYDDSTIEAVALATGERRVLLSGASIVRALPPDRLLFGRDGKIFVIPLEDAHDATLGTARAAIEGLAGIPASGIVHFDVSLAGDLAYVEGDPRATQLELAWVARDGGVTPLALPPREYRTPRLSLDGTRIAVGIGPGGGRTSDVWIVDIERTAATRLTFDTRSITPSWISDERVLYASQSGEHQGFYLKRADGTEEAERIAEFPDDIPRFPSGLSADGDLVPFVTQGGAGTAQDIFYWSRAEQRVLDIAKTAASENYCALSRDGGWLAYVTSESGVRELYVQGFPGGHGRWQISDGGGDAPCWSRDGRELYFVHGDRILGVPITTTPSFTHGAPREIVRAEFDPAAESVVNYDVAADGRFLVVRGTSQDSYDRHVNVVLGWGASLASEKPAER